MKKLLFNELLIHSTKEKKAKRITFDPQRTLIYGGNDTGKSSAIKTLFSTFGASPAKVNPQWKDIDPISLVKFSVDGIEFSILKEGKTYSIFNAAHELLKTCKSVTDDLGPFLAELLDFKIKLPNQKNNVITPPPAFIFMPFYVDQDTGWGDTWKSFGSIKQLKNPIESIIHYHTGIRPNEYYDAKSELSAYEEGMDNLKRELSVTNGVLHNMRSKMSTTEFNIDVEQFKDEIKELLVECDKLKKIEEKHKNTLVDLHNQMFVIDSQIEIADRTLKESKRDYKYATDVLPDTVECPTCGAGYENSFSERFEIALDTDRCQELLDELISDKDSLNDKIFRESTSLNKTTVEIAKLEEILQRKKGEIVLKDVIESAGRNEVNRIFGDKVEELNEEIRANLLKQEELKGKLKSLENKKRKAEITDLYLLRIKQNLQNLEVSSVKEKDYKKISGNINTTGSSLPRALMSYYFSIFHVIQRYSSAVYCPIVIDSPNQQAQDMGHIDKILKFIDENQPKDTQMILGIEELYDIDFKCPLVELKESHSLLQEKDYDEVGYYVSPLLEIARKERGMLF